MTKTKIKQNLCYDYWFVVDKIPKNL